MSIERDGNLYNWGSLWKLLSNRHWCFPSNLTPILSKWIDTGKGWKMLWRWQAKRKQKFRSIFEVLWIFSTSSVSEWYEALWKFLQFVAEAIVSKFAMILHPRNPIWDLRLKQRLQKSQRYSKLIKNMPGRTWRVWLRVQRWRWNCRRSWEKWVYRSWLKKYRRCWGPWQKYWRWW